MRTVSRPKRVVTVVGQRDDFYKILPPERCHFWISLDFVERTMPVTDEIVARFVGYGKETCEEAYD